MRERLSLEFETTRLGIAPTSRNTYWAEKLGWIQHLDRITALLGLDFTPASLEDPAFRRGVARWQALQGDIKPDGILGPQTWSRLVDRVSVPPAAGVQPLAIAKRLAATRFSGWTHGDAPAKRQINCVQFVRAVLEEILGHPVAPEIKADIEIAHSDMVGREAQAIAAEDPRLGGISYALEKYGLGRGIPTSRALPGDFLQCWFKTSDGQWDGHASLIENVVSETPDRFVANIFGAHHSKNAICTRSISLVRKKLIYLSRLSTANQP